MPNLERGASQRDSPFLFSLVFQFFIFNREPSLDGRQGGSLGERKEYPAFGGAGHDRVTLHGGNEC